MILQIIILLEHVKVKIRNVYKFKQNLGYSFLLLFNVRCQKFQAVSQRPPLSNVEVEYTVTSPEEVTVPILFFEQLKKAKKASLFRLCSMYR